jgi:hypothetical protein
MASQEDRLGKSGGQSYGGPSMPQYVKVCLLLRRSG